MSKPLTLYRLIANEYFFSLLLLIHLTHNYSSRLNIKTLKLLIAYFK